MDTMKIIPLTSEQMTALTPIGIACYYGRAFAAPIDKDRAAACNWKDRVDALHAAAYDYAAAARIPAPVDAVKRAAHAENLSNLRTAVYNALDRVDAVVWDGPRPRRAASDVDAVLAIVGRLATVNSADYAMLSSNLNIARRELKANADGPADVVAKLTAARDTARAAVKAAEKVEFAHYKTFSAVSANSFRKALENLVGDRVDPAAAPAPTLEEIRAARKARRDAKKAANKKQAATTAAARERAKEKSDAARDASARNLASLHAANDAVWDAAAAESEFVDTMTAAADMTAAPVPVVVAYNDGVDVDENGVKHVYIG